MTKTNTQKKQTKANKQTKNKTNKIYKAAKNVLIKVFVLYILICMSIVDSTLMKIGLLFSVLCYRAELGVLTAAMAENHRTGRRMVRR